MKWYCGEVEKALVGKTLQAVRVSPDQGCMVFICKEGNFFFEAYGDCCSHSYIQDVDGPCKGKIIAVGETNGGTKEEDYNVIKYHNVVLTIEGKGHLIVEFRNESNGYYDGNLQLCNERRGWQNWKST